MPNYAFNRERGDFLHIDLGQKTACQHLIYEGRFSWRRVESPLSLEALAELTYRSVCSRCLKVEQS